MKCQFLGKWSNKLEGNIVADILFIAINFLKYPAIKAPLFFILKKVRACLVKKINNFSTLYTIVLLFFPSIFKCYSFIEYIDSIEYIVYLINTQRCRVPLYFTSCNIVISSVPDKGSLDIERFFTAKTTHISYSVHYIYDLQFPNSDQYGTKPLASDD